MDLFLEILLHFTKGFGTGSMTSNSLNLGRLVSDESAREHFKAFFTISYYRLLKMYDGNNIYGNTCSKELFVLASKQ